MPLNLRLPERLAVRKWDYANRRYDPANKDVPILYGQALEAHCRQQYQRFDGRTVRRYLRDQGVLLADVWRSMGIADNELLQLQVRDVISNDATLPFFGPMVEDGIRLGLQQVTLPWQDIIAATIPATLAGVKWYRLEASSGDENFQLRSIGQGAEIPVSVITTSTAQIVLSKKGRGIQWTDEAKNAPLSIAQLFLSQVGLELGNSYARMMVNVLINGYQDDNTDDPLTLNTLDTTKFQRKDLLRAKNKMLLTKGIPSTDMIASSNTMIDLETMENASGNLVFPNGLAQDLGVTPHISPDMDDDTIIFLNRGYALLRYVEQELGTEDERYASRQLTGSYATMIDQVTVGIPESRITLEKGW